MFKAVRIDGHFHLHHGPGDLLGLFIVLLELIFYVTEPAFDPQRSGDKLHPRNDFICRYPLENTNVLVDLLGRFGVVRGGRLNRLPPLGNRRRRQNQQPENQATASHTGLERKHATPMIGQSVSPTAYRCGWTIRSLESLGVAKSKFTIPRRYKFSKITNNIVFFLDSVHK